jgi:hypothetical protein
MKFVLALALLAPAPAAWAQNSTVPAPPSETIPWLPRTTASVQALDKVNARGSVLSIEVGHSATFGSLIIAVKACVVRPPDVPADAAAFLTVTDKNPNEPGFTGWMLKAAPAVSMLEHPIYDLRIVGCS